MHTAGGSICLRVCCFYANWEGRGGEKGGEREGGVESSEKTERERRVADKDVERARGQWRQVERKGSVATPLSIPSPSPPSPSTGLFINCQLICGKADSGCRLLAPLILILLLLLLAILPTASRLSFHLGIQSFNHSAI